MIYGIGVDIVEVKRFEKWVKKTDMINRFFHKDELSSASSLNILCEHYAARFACKEAFSKALGTGLCGFNLDDVYIVKNIDGKPELKCKDKAKEILEKRCGNCKIHVSLSHEKAFAIAYVVIETK